ncbi:Uncharacterized protein dnm_040960 [Desulfonema magnum]|uniref:Uncharacterized protein n=1 Tax=Desulfonema magnum TaxID=45655 RepID=A0A975BM91_9BACT|nr:Uncharacterized protein dnm_040960 [Desulfonema magnum]
MDFKFISDLIGNKKHRSKPDIRSAKLAVWQYSGIPGGQVFCQTASLALRIVWPLISDNVY